MKNTFKLLVAAGAILGTAATFTATATPAMAQPMGFSFRVGDVAFAYNNGYYDHNRRWHSWRNVRERNWYRTNYRRGFRAWNYDRDRDGIPNSWDRDRDNDGVSNAYDRAPNNPYRR